MKTNNKRIVSHSGTAAQRNLEENKIGTQILDSAFYLHKNLGPGLLESVYEAVLARLLSKKGLFVQRQVSIPIEFEGEYY